MAVKRNLTAKQRLFIRYYLETLNATEAARLAGYKGNDVTLAGIGYENRRKPQIAAEIDAGLAQAAMPKNEVLARRTRIAAGDMTDFMAVDEQGIKVDLIKASRAGKLGLVKKVDQTETSRTDVDGNVIVTRRIKVELYGADEAQKDLMRYHGMYDDKVTVTWQDEIGSLLRNGTLTPEDVVNEIGPDLARELFESAGIPAVTSREAQD